jgi:hypothetical protein
MGWHQRVRIQSQQQFLIDLLRIDIDDVVRRRLVDAGLEVVSLERVRNADIEDAPGCGPDTVLRLTLSDGRQFTQRLVRSRTGEDWGVDYYAFVEERGDDGGLGYDDFGSPT